jgi:hypothetical protein
MGEHDADEKSEWSKQVLRVLLMVALVFFAWVKNPSIAE